MNELKEIARDSRTVEEALAALHDAGASPVHAIKALCDGRSLSVRDAKVALMESPSWSEEADAANKMWEELAAEPSGKFEVTEHVQLTERGPFILGHIREGVVKIGDTIDWPHQQGVLTVGGVDFADNITEHKTWIALHFLENPTSADLEQAFPVGTLIHIYAGE